MTEDKKRPATDAFGETIHRIGRNVRCRIARGNMLVLEVDLDKELGPSKTGKSVVMGTTGGNVPIPGGGGAYVGVTVYVPISETPPMGAPWAPHHNPNKALPNPYRSAESDEYRKRAELLRQRELQERKGET